MTSVRRLEQSPESWSKQTDQYRTALVQSGVPILTAPGNPLAERVHVGAGGKQGFDSTEVTPPGGIEQLAVKDTRVAARTGRSHEGENKNNGGEQLHGVLTPSPDRTT